MSAAALLGGLINAPAALADIEVTEAWTIAEGGRLYDKWNAVLNYDMKNASTHPSYPNTSKQKG